MARNIPGIKHIKNAINVRTEKVDDFGGMFSQWSQIDLIDPIDTNLVMQSGIAEHTDGDDVIEHVQQKHQVTFILEGQMIIQDVDTGEVYKAKAGDLLYWGPGLRMRSVGKFRALFTRTPVVWRWTKTPDGKKKVLNLFNVPNETRYPGTPPDEIREEPIE